MAPIAPSAVEFQIHQVVPAFHNNILKKQNKKKRIALSSLSATHNKGIQAKNISTVKYASGHAKINSNPDNKLSKNDAYFFKKKMF